MKTLAMKTTAKMTNGNSDTNKAIKVTLSMTPVIITLIRLIGMTPMIKSLIIKLLTMKTPKMKTPIKKTPIMRHQ